MTATYTTPLQMTDGYLMTANYWNEQVTNNLDYLKARPIARVSDLDGTVSNTTSTSFADITGASVSITTAGSSRLLILATVEMNNSTAPATVALTALVDGTNQGDATRGLLQNSPTTPYAHWSIAFLTTAAVADGAHTVKLQYKTSTGTLTCYMFTLTVLEVY